MKKTRFIALVLAVAVMLIGAGYAWWFETVTITSTIESGWLDMDIVSFNADDHDDFVTIEPETQEFSDDDGNDNNDSITLKIDNLYPGAQGSATIEIKNNSTMDVKIPANTTIAYDADGSLVPDFFWETWKVQVQPGYQFDPDGNVIDLDHDGLTGWGRFDSNTDIVVPKDQSLFIVIEANMPTNPLDPSGSELENASASFVVAPTFQQFNR